MKRVLLFEEFVKEGVYDQGILKAFFMAGGPGSGKSYVASEIFGFSTKALTSVSYATGLKLVNNDNAFEKELKKAGYDAAKLGEYANDVELWTNIMTLRDKAKKINTSLEIALERNETRERVLPVEIVEKMWKDVQDNLGKFQKLFGADKMLIIDNSEYGVNVLGQIESQVSKNITKPVKNPLGKIWIKEAIASKKR